MEADVALVGADCIVVLHAVPAVGANVALIVHPAYAETDDTIRFRQAFKDQGILVFRIALDEGDDVSRNLLDSLVEFGLAGIAALQPTDEV